MLAAIRRANIPCSGFLKLLQRSRMETLSWLLVVLDARVAHEGPQAWACYRRGKLLFLNADTLASLRGGGR